MVNHQFTLRDLLICVPWFGLASLLFAAQLQLADAATMARAVGRGVCGNSAILNMMFLPPAVAAGGAALFGRHWLAAWLGVPTLLLAIPHLIEVSKELAVIASWQ